VAQPVMAQPVAIGQPVQGSYAPQGAGIDAGADKVPPPSKSMGEPVSNEQPPGQYRDPVFAVLFILQVLVTIILSFALGAANVGDIQISSSTDGASTMGACVLAILVALVLSVGLLKFIVRFAEGLITTILVGSGVICIIAGIATIGSFGIIFLLYGLFMLAYYYCVRNRIPFASATLSGAAEVVNKFPSLTCYAFFVQVITVVYVILWILATLGVALVPATELEATYTETDGTETVYTFTIDDDCATTSDDTCLCAEGFVFAEWDGTCEDQKTLDGGIFTIMLFLAYWATATFANIMILTSTGAAGTYLFTGSTSSFNVVASSFKRACTTSLGTASFAALILAIIRTIKFILKQQKRNFIAICLLQCIERLFEYFNRWAMACAGIYGHSFYESGKAVMNLFKSRGLTVIINDQLLENLFTFFVVTVAIIACVIGYYIGDGMDGAEAWMVAIVGFLAGMCISSIMVSVVDACISAVVVIFVEDPGAIQAQHNEMYTKLTAGFLQTFGYSAWDATAAAQGRA